MTNRITTVDYERIFSDLAIEPRSFDSLVLPSEIRVPSKSAIKIDVVSGVLEAIRPNMRFNVVGVTAPSEVNEQPVGIEAIDGAMNRLHNGRLADGLVTAAWFCIENGIFAVSEGNSNLVLPHRGLDIETQGIDVSPEYQPAAEYEDRAVAVLAIPGYGTTAEISIQDEAIIIPRIAVRAAYNDTGSFGIHTAGSKLAEMGLVRDKQDPHIDLTNGEFSRREQMTRVIIRALTRLV